MVLAYLDDKSKLVSRLASTQWFKQIRYSHFTLNRTRDDWETIAARLSQYNFPISITFSYDPQRQLAQLFGHLTTLTNLESLSLGLVDRRFIQVEDWFKLTCLTNLKRLSAEATIPFELYSSMTWLRNLSATGSIADAKRIVQQLPYLVDLHYINDRDQTDDAFDLVKELSHLTNLFVYYTEWNAAKEESTKSLSNLKQVTWISHSGTVEASLKYMTALEQLNTSISFHSVTSTHITSLVIWEHAIKSTVENHVKFCKLKSLSVTFDEEAPPFGEALASFTALESLTLRNCSDEHCDAINTLVKSTNLIDLQLCHCKLPPLSFTSLTKLALDDVSGDCGGLSNLVYLTRLDVSSESLQGTLSAPLTNVKCLVWRCSKANVDLRLLTSLEYLDLSLNNSSMLTGLERATNLTNLTLASQENIVVDFGFLKNLTVMKDLCIANIICQNLWQHLAGLKNLRSLEVPRMEREEQVLLLTNMTALRHLKTTAQYVKGKDIFSYHSTARS